MVRSWFEESFFIACVSTRCGAVRCSFTGQDLGRYSSDGGTVVAGEGDTGVVGLSESVGS